MHKHTQPSTHCHNNLPVGQEAHPQTSVACLLLLPVHQVFGQDSAACASGGDGSCLYDPTWFQISFYCIDQVSMLSRLSDENLLGSPHLCCCATKFFRLSRKSSFFLLGCSDSFCHRLFKTSKFPQWFSADKSVICRRHRENT